MDPVQAELLTALSRLYRSGKYSDLTVVCNSARYKVHKALLCSRSRFFDAACSSGFLEAKKGVIDLSEENAEVIAHLMDYFYYLNYDMDEGDDDATPPSSYRPSSLTKVKGLDISHANDPLVATASTLSPPLSRSSSPPTRQSMMNGQDTTPRAPKLLSRRQIQMRRPRGSSGSSTQDSPPPLTPSSCDPDDMDLSDDDDDDSDDDETPTPRLLLHARIYSAAEKYGIPGLKALAKLKFETRLCPPNIEAFNAGPLSSHEAREMFLREEFPAAMEEVYTGTVDGDRGLREAVVQTFRAHPEWGRRREVAEVIRENGTLGWDLYRASSGMPSHGR